MKLYIFCHDHGLVDVAVTIVFFMKLNVNKVMV